MYGLLVENLASFVRIQWGEGKWDMVRKNAGIDAVAFSIHHVYPETLLNKLARSAFQVLGVDDKNFFEAMGIYFVEYVGQYGYDAMLTVLGRHLRDFLNGLDNLHEYLKFSYTKMRPPSFFCDEETAEGLRLHYRSRRRGFVYYVMGQIKQVARHFYNMECEIAILSEMLDGDTMHTIFQLTFDNDAFSEAESLKTMIRKEQQLPIRASIIFELFPFCIVFDQEMCIKFTGHALLTILKDLVGQVMTEAFEIVRPLITFCFSTILERRNNIFELITVAPIKDDEALTGSFENESDEETGTALRLRGQMLFMEEWEMMLFLANPVMPDLESLVHAGLFVNDLSLHDCSRDLVLAGTQQSVELKLALDQEQQKSKKLEESMKKLDDEMKKTDELLFQMIPQKVADRIRRGENPVDTCETFESVSILFSDVVTFTDICSRISPIQVVVMLNHMYSLFDQLTERNGVYKVETIGDSYMVVSGAPDPMAQHAERICDMGMDMCDAMAAVGDPSRDGEPLKIRVGIHSGSVVAGIVGVKMPRYCLFGDTVNTASRMESTSEGGKIQISEFTQKLLPTPYQAERRGTIAVKGKGEMETFFLLGRENRVPLSKASSKSFNWTAPTAPTMSEPAKAASTGLVKDVPKQAKETKKIVRQPTISRIRLEQTNPPTSLTEPKNPSFNEPVDTKKDTPKPSTNEAKPTPPPASTTPKPAPTPAPPPAAAPPKEAPKPTPAPAPKPAAPPTPAPKQDEPPPSQPAKAPSPAPPPSQTNPPPTTPAASEKPSQPPPSKAPPPTPSAAQTIDLPPQNIRRTSTPTVEVTDTSTKVVTFTPEPEKEGANPNAPNEQPATNATPNLEEGNEDTTPNDVTTNETNVNGETEANDTGKSKNPFIDGFNGIRKGSKDFREKIKDKKLSTVTIEAITDIGCTEFAAKQKEIISQACMLL